MNRKSPRSKTVSGITELFEQPRYAPKNHSVARLMAEYTSTYMPVFERVKSEWNPTIREFYRSSMGLKLYSGAKGRRTAGDSGVAIQIRPDKDDAFLKALDTMLADVDFDLYARLRQLREHLIKAEAYFVGHEIRKPYYTWMRNELTGYLTKNSIKGPFRTLMHTPGRHRSLFGTYTFGDQHVELFYMPLLIFCKIQEVDLQWAIVVTLAHELAHAYHHAGKDNDGQVWPSMPKAHLWVTEGLAEYFTEQFVAAHEHAYPALRKAHERMLEGSGEEYRSYLTWRDSYSLEQVKLALHLVRRQDVRSYEAFLRTLDMSKRMMK